jgi:hypothetical protein
MSDVVLVVEEFHNEVMYDPKGSYYIRNALGQVVWIKTRNRQKAQEAIDKEYGIGKYSVLPVHISKGADSVTCRAVATRKGQYVQSQRARILNN